MRIAFFLPNLEGGGAERVCVNLGKAFRQRGLEVDFVLVRASGPLLGELPADIRLIDLQATRTLKSVPGLRRYLRHTKPDALIAAPDIANLAAGFAGWSAGGKTRILATNHNNLIQQTMHTRKPQERAYPWLLRLLMPRFAAFVTVSQGNAEALRSLVPNSATRLQVIYNPIVRNEIGALAAVPVDHPWFRKNQPPVLLAVGRLELQKDYPTLLRSFAIFRERRAARLMILGEGSQRRQLQDLANELGISADLCMPGFEENPFQYMAACRVFILSSAWEGFGNVLVEALACGAQIVATDCPSGPAEILEHGKYGKLVPVADPTSMASALEAAMDQPILASTLRSRAADFSVEAAASAYLAALRING